MFYQEVRYYFSIRDGAVQMAACIARFTLKTRLTFGKVEKTEHEKFFSFFFLLYSSFFLSIKHNSITIRFAKILNIKRLVFYCRLFVQVFIFVRAMTGELWPRNRRQHASRFPRTLLSFQCNYCMGRARMVRPQPRTTERLRYRQRRVC